MQVCTDLDNAECSVVANSMVHGTVICTIKSFPPVEKATYSCENQRVDLTWKEIESADMLGVSKYQANASISSNDMPIFTRTCRLTTANVYGQFNETLNEGQCPILSLYYALRTIYLYIYIYFSPTFNTYSSATSNH